MRASLLIAGEGPVRMIKDMPAAAKDPEVTQRVNLGDVGYPELLAHIPGAPKQLYYRGDLSVLDAMTVAVVGARKATDYGRWVSSSVAKKCAEAGVVVVSGMAEGIDSCAHRGALEAGAPTVAVMGCGLDICYPAFNGDLRKRILETGALVSEYPDGTNPGRHTFPARNRIISGLSMATVIAEAGLSSGSLITAECAATQGREVYAVPGNINRVSSIGCNKLIQDGARPLILIDDFLTDMGIRKAAKGPAVEGLGGDEIKLLALVAEHGEVSLSDIAALSGMRAPKVTAIVTILEMKGLVSTCSGKVAVSG